MLTVNGQKMSKSKGTLIKADIFAKHLNPESIRYYFAYKLKNKSQLEKILQKHYLKWMIKKK